ncbi:MAG: Obg family GTPase CgtA [Patescibacteria group bacterium]
MLIDSVEITVRAGKGGDGAVSWRREKHVPRGGPDGGDGGAGGDVVLYCDNNVDTLTSFRYRKVFQAGDGERGASKKKTGRGGSDLTLTLPVGTIVQDAETGRVIRDFVEIGARYVIARGGHGGLGNPHFVSATHQAPEESTPGKPGQSKALRMELRLIADIALVGEPNAGKSSIINCLTDANSRIGAYAFSTHEPVLGVMNGGANPVTLVDLPGLLEGAHQGKGLGDQFLKHAQRVKAIAHVVDASQPEPRSSLKKIRRELAEFDASLTKRPSLVIFNKIDLLSEPEQQQLTSDFPDALLVSANTKEGIEVLRQRLVELSP